MTAIEKRLLLKNVLIQAGRRVGKTASTTVAMTYQLADDLALTGDERTAFLASVTAAFGFFSEPDDEENA